MAAPRKYTDAQRAEIFRLFEQGLPSNEISERCAHGSAAVEPFKVPRRTVSAIAARMAKEHKLRFPATADDLDRIKSVERYPERVAKILGNEIERLETKQCRGPLNVADLELMQKAVALSGPLAKRLAGQQPPAIRGHSKDTERPRRTTEAETFVEKLAREEREAERETDRLAATDTHHEPEDVRRGTGPDSANHPEPETVDSEPPPRLERSPEYIPAPYEGSNPDPLYLAVYERNRARREASETTGAPRDPG